MEIPKEIRRSLLKPEAELAVKAGLEDREDEGRPLALDSTRRAIRHHALDAQRQPLLPQCSLGAPASWLAENRVVLVPA